MRIGIWIFGQKLSIPTIVVKEHRGGLPSTNGAFWCFFSGHGHFLHCTFWVTDFFFPWKPGGQLQLRLQTGSGIMFFDIGNSNSSHFLHVQVLVIWQGFLTIKILATLFVRPSLFDLTNFVMFSSMTTLLTHTVAHSTSLPLGPKPITSPLKSF